MMENTIEIFGQIINTAYAFAALMTAILFLSGTAMSLYYKVKGAKDKGRAASEALLIMAGAIEKATESRSPARAEIEYASKTRGGLVEKLIEWAAARVDKKKPNPKEVI